MPKNKSFMFGLLLTIYLFLIIFYSSYFRPSKWLNISDSEKFSGQSWVLQQTVSINDYLPVYAKAAPNKPAAPDPEIIDGKVEFTAKETGTNWQRWRVNVESESAEIRLQTFYFPGWKAWQDGNERVINHNNDQGLISLNIDKGVHVIYIKLTDTPVRKIGNLASIMGFAYVPYYLIKRRK